jgi:hypothetical protein
VGGGGDGGGAWAAGASAVPVPPTSPPRTPPSLPPSLPPSCPPGWLSAVDSGRVDSFISLGSSLGMVSSVLTGLGTFFASARGCEGPPGGGGGGGGATLNSTSGASTCLWVGRAEA